MKIRRADVLALGLAGLLLLTACTNTAVPKSAFKIAPLMYDAASEITETVAERAGMQLLFNNKDASVTLRDTRTGREWSSTPAGYDADAVAGDDVKQRMASQITLEYYDAQNNQRFLYSARDCVALQQFRTEKTANGIIVDMVLGSEDLWLLVPPALPADSFENNILAKMPDSLKGQVKAYYKKYDPALMSAGDIDQIAQLYPLARTKPIYVMKALVDREKKQLSEHISQSGYTFEQMKADLKETGAKVLENQTPYFRLQIEYTLDKNGDLVASVPCGSLQYDDSKFSLNRLYLLEYFAAAPKDREGYLVIPDGCGAVMMFNRNGQKGGREITLPIYGGDTGLSFVPSNQNKRVARVPVYGIKQNDTLLMAVVESGAAQASITASAGGSTSGFAAVGASLSYRDLDTFNFDGIRAQTTWVLLDKNVCQTDFSIRFRLLQDDTADYNGMAAAYRSYLLKKSELKQNPSSGQLPFTVGLLGTVTHTETTLIFPTEKLIPLTTFADAQDIAGRLRDAGVQNLALRYLGCANGGLENQAYNRFSPESILGGGRGFKALTSYLTGQNIPLYPDAEMQFVMQNSPGDGFSPGGQAARLLNKQYAGYLRMDLATNLENRDSFAYTLNPRIMLDFFQRFQRKYQQYSLTTLSLGSVGACLNSDKDEKKPVNRVQSEIISRELLSQAAADRSVMVSGGNAYAYPYVQQIIGLDSDCSGYLETDYSIPFLQMVLHGSVAYSSPAINLSRDASTELLKAVENGAGLYYEFAARNAVKLKETRVYTYYSADFGAWFNRATDDYKRAAAVLNGLEADTIDRHEYVSPGVSVTTYSSGVRVVVNYTGTDCMVQGQTVPSRDFVRINP